MAPAKAARPATDTGIGRKGVSALWVTLSNLFFIAESLLLLYAAIVFWPATSSPVSTQTTTQVTETTVQFLGQPIAMTRDQNLLLIVAILGGLGAMGHVMRSFFRYVGERNLVWSWMAQYLLLPFIGAILATISYILLRAGLIGGGTVGGQEGNIWGFAAVAALVGLFTAQAAAKLKSVFEVVLAPSPPGSETLASAAPAPIAFSPMQGAVGTSVEITGPGLDTATAVTFGGGVDSTPQWVADRKVLTTTVPDNAQSGPLKVTTDSGIITSKDDFKVLP